MILSTSKSKQAVRHYRYKIACLILLALVGGYLLAALTAVVLAKTLALYFALPQGEAALAATLTGIAVYPAVIIWSFYMDCLRKIALSILGMCLLFTTVNIFINLGVA